MVMWLYVNYQEHSTGQGRCGKAAFCNRFSWCSACWSSHSLLAFPSCWGENWLTSSIHFSFMNFLQCDNRHACGSCLFRLGLFMTYIALASSCHVGFFQLTPHTALLYRSQRSAASWNLVVFLWLLPFSPHNSWTLVIRNSARCVCTSLYLKKSSSVSVLSLSSY